MTEELERFLRSSRAGGTTARTVEAYRSTVNLFIAHLRTAEGQFPTMESFTLDHVEEWIEAMLDGDCYARESIRSHARRLRAMSRRMFERKQIPTHVLGALVTPKAVRQQLFVPSQETVEAMLFACDDATKSGRLDRALIACLADSGVRRSELVAANVTDVDWELGVIRLANPAKGGLPRWAPLGHASRDYLRAAVGYRNSGPLFLDRRFDRMSGKAALHRVADASIRAGADRRIGPQLLRRFAATRLTVSGASEPLLFRVMGWTPDPKHVAWPAYINLGASDISSAFAMLSPVDHLML